MRKAYGDEAVDASNRKLLDLSEKQYSAMQALEGQIKAALEAAVAAGESPAGPEGARIAALHRDWLGYTWAKYSPQAHKGLGQMYVADERFTAYYDAGTPGCARWLCDAIQAHV